MSSSKALTLIPRNGKKLKVLGIGRISTDKQDEKSLDDQEALIHEWLKKNYEGQHELIMIKGIGSGERIDRKDYEEAIVAIETKAFDLCIAEDLSRICRRVHATLFCEHCIDHGTRLITINEGIDTTEKNWQVLASISSIR